MKVDRGVGRKEGEQGEHEKLGRSGCMIEKESKGKDIWKVETIVGLARNQTLANSQESTRMTPAKDISNSGEGT